MILTGGAIQNLYLKIVKESDYRRDAWRPWRP